MAVNEQYNWLITPTKQNSWVAGHGLMVWLSVAFGLVGAGGFLVAVFLGNFYALLTSWLIVTVLKNLVHLIHAKSITNALRMASRPGTSWLSRGAIFSALFSLLGLIYLLIEYLVPGNEIATAFLYLTGLAAIGIIIYEGFLIGSNKAVPFWNTSMTPVTFALWAILSGSTLSMVLPKNPDLASTAFTLTVGLAIATLICVLILVWNASHSDETSGSSASDITKGSLAACFWYGAVLVGLVAPLAILAYCVISDIPITLLVGGIVAAAVVIGTLSYTYCIFKAGKTRSLI